MKFISFGNGSVTMELDPAECFLIAEACTAAVRYDATANMSLVETIGAALTAGGMAGSAMMHMQAQDWKDYTLPKVRQVWVPVEDGHVH